MIHRLLGTALVLGLGATLASAQAAMDVSLLSIGTVETQLAEHSALLDAQRAKKETLDIQLGTLPATRAALEQSLTRDVRALYRLRRGGLLPIVSGLEALMSHASRVAHFERLTRRTLTRLSETRSVGAELQRETSEIALQIAATDEQLQTLQAAKASLLRAQAAEQRDAESLLLPVSAPPSLGALEQLGQGFAFSDGNPQPGEQPLRFSAQRGDLAMPVSGSVTLTDVPRPSGDGAALRLQAESGASVRAAAAGRVAFAERNDFYGLFVIVDHGGRYRTIYGGLDSLDVQPGDAISKSARLGAAGMAPIYFEVRRGKRSQDARAWLGL